jgi:hypothetical protein
MTTEISETTKKSEKVTITLTFGDAGENHTGMEMLGSLGEPGSGFSPEQLKQMASTLAEAGLVSEYHDLTLSTSENVHDEAGLLVIRNYLDQDRSTSLLEELLSLEWDRRYWDKRRGKVLNKLARANLLIVDGMSQTPQYELGKGTIIDGLSLEVFSQCKDNMVKMINHISQSNKADGLVCEGNLYENPRKNGIGYHGDTERRKVIALRLGQEMPMCWQWFHRSERVGEPRCFNFGSGDLYLMSEKAVGNDWRKSSLYTLRHAAGGDKYIKPKPKKKS